MAGGYGSICSRADFFVLLADARRALAELLPRAPQHPTLLSIQRQLDAIDGWTRGNREPSVQERTSLDMVLRAVRELSDTGDAAVEAFNQKIFTLSLYFQNWPSDEEVASSKDTDPAFLRRPSRQ